MTKKLFIGQIIIVLLFSSLVTYSQSPERILIKAIKAQGGKRVLKNITSYKRSGMISRVRDGISGSYQAQVSQPNSFITFFDLEGFESAFGYNGKSGWYRDSKNGLQTLTGAASRDFQALASYRNNLWFNYKKEKSKIRYGGQTNIKGKNADVIIMTTAKGVSIKMFFDKVSGLLIREEIPFGEFLNSFEYSDFRAINGIQEPFTINAAINNENYEIKLDSVVHNPQISEAVFNFPQISNDPLPDIPTLLKELQANEDRIEDILENYTYKQINISRELGKDGVLREKESETFQLSFYKGYRICRLIAKNGKPLSADEQEKEDKKVQERVADIEKEIAKKESRTVQQSSAGTPDEDSRRISIAEVLRASNLINPRREQFRGREVIVFDFEPNSNFDFKDAKSFLKFFGKTAGVMWIDAKDKQVARVDAVLFDNYKVGGGLLANLKKGATFTLENNRINNEVWLPYSADINLSVKILLVKGINVNQLIKYSDYQKFNTEVQDSKVDEIKKPL